MPIDLNAPEIKAAIAMADAQLAGEQRDRKIPGLSAGVVYDQQLIWQRGYGYSDLEKQIPADSRTVYRIASITKLFTSTMLMKLRDAGKLNLDDPIEKYLPQFKIKTSFNDPRPPTFRMVASHAAGLPREGKHRGWGDLNMPTIDTLLADLDDDEMRLPTMTEPKYSNLGVGIMGYALSQIAGKPYGDYVTDEVLKPLGMTNSGFARPTDDHYAVGYWRDGDTFKPSGHWDEQGFRPGGGMYSTVDDITKFIAMQFRDQPANGKDQVLGSSTIREMQMPVSVTQDFETGFGIGWGIRRLAGSKVVGHSGGLPGYTTNISLVPGLKLAAIVFTNTGTDPVSMSNKVLELLIPVFKRVQARDEVQASPDMVESWKRYAGRYTRDGDESTLEIIDGKLYFTGPGEGLDTAVRLLPHAEHQFRMAGGHSSGDTVTFDFNDAGEIVRLWLGAYPMDRAD